MSLHPCVLCITLHAEASQSSTSGSVAARGVHGAAGVNDKTTIFPLATRNRGQISAPRQAARASATQAGTCSARAQLSSAGPGSESSNRAWRRPPCCAGAAARAPARPRRRQQRRPRRRLRRAPRSAPPAPPARPRAPRPPRAPARRARRQIWGVLRANAARLARLTLLSSAWRQIGFEGAPGKSRPRSLLAHLLPHTRNPCAVNACQGSVGTGEGVAAC